MIEYQHGIKRYRHPLVGNLSFDFESFQLPTDPGLTMLIYTAQSGSPTEEALRILESWTTDSAAAQPSADQPPARSTGPAQPRTSPENPYLGE